jgi:hypothetical protein
MVSPADAASPATSPRTGSNPPPAITPNEFEGSDAERINRAIEAATAAGGRVVIPRVNVRGGQRRDVWLIDSAILLRSNVTLELEDCRIKLSDRCRDNLMRSANCGRGIADIRPMRNIHIRGLGRAVLEGADRPRATGDSAKTLGAQTYGTDAGRAGESQKGDWRNLGILLAFVEDFSIENLAIKDSHGWAISLERCANGSLRDIDFASSQFKVIDGARRTILNQDGIDLRMGCHDILIENITGYTGDDLVALTAIPGASRAGSVESTMVSATANRGQGLDDIHHVALKNIRGFCRGGHHIVRFLNTSGVRLYDVLLDGLTDTSPPDVHGRAALKIGDKNPRWGGVTPLGDTSRITVRNVTSRSQHAVLIAGSLTDSTISDVVHQGSAAEPVTMESGPQNVRNVTITNVRAAREVPAADAALQPLEKDLLWLLNFEQDDLLLTSGGGMLPLSLDSRHYVAGKFGRGFYFEPPQQNLFPPAIADVEDEVGGLTALKGASLALMETAARLGKKSLALTLPAAGSGAAAPVVRCQIRPTAPWAEKTVSLIASCYVKGPKGSNIKLDLQLAPAADPLDPKTKQPVADRKPDAPGVAIVALTGDWQRVACLASGDSRLGEREATLSLLSAAEAPVNLLVDGFQLEQGNLLPYFRTMPTTWTPGGQRRSKSVITINHPDLLNAFPVHQGTISFWTCTPPADSNLSGTGSVSWFALCRGWTDPEWAVDTYHIASGVQIKDGKPAPTYSGGSLSAATDGKWHHVAMVWENNHGVLYKDGQAVMKLERQDVDLGGQLETYVMRIGGGRDGAANSVVDEFAVFKRALSAEEVARLAAGAAPLRITGSACALAGGVRSTFYRDETSARFTATLTSLGLPDGPVIVDGAIANLLAFQQRVELIGGKATVTFDFVPAQLKCGVSTCRMAVSAANGTPAGYREFPVNIVPSLRRDQFLLSSWGSNLSADWLRFYRTLGLNTLDFELSDPKIIDRIGAQGFAYNWHYNFDREGDYTPARRETVKAEAGELAARLAPLPNWRGVLLNTETGPGHAIPNDQQRKAWFDAWAESDFGAKIPASGWALGSSHNHVGCRFPDDAKPGPDGVYRTMPETLRFLKWWNDRGGLYWRINALGAQAVKAVRPDVVTWTDPMCSAGEIAELDAGSSWSYSTDPAEIVNELQAAYDLTRGTGKPFYATLGMNYCGPGWLTVTEPDGVKKSLMPTPDDMIQQSWLSVAAIPSAGMTFWDLNGWFDGLRVQKTSYDSSGAVRYCPPKSDEALGTVLKNDLVPLGTMLQGVPNAQRPLALLLPESTIWFGAGEGGFGWGAYHYPNIWKKWVNRSGIPCDYVFDHHITPGALAKYRVVIFPMAQFVSEPLYRELTAAAKAGTKIIVDSYCKQTYPNMVKTGVKYEIYWTWPKEKQEAYAAEATRLLEELRASLEPHLAAYAVGKEGRVFVNVREANGVRYVCAINNHRQPGPYTEWTRHPEFMPYGKAQQATVYLNAPKESVVYEFTTSRRLPATYENGKLAVTLDLPPAAGRVLCVYPAAFSILTSSVAPEYRLGVPGSIEVHLLGQNGQPVPGRQMVDVRIADPAGQPHDESGFYRLDDGTARIPFRPALNDKPGRWSVSLRERSSGLEARLEIEVKGQTQSPSP